MDIQEHTTPSNLIKYAFFWSLARMVIAAFSLFFGAMPIAYSLLGSNMSSSLLPLFWLISGAAAVYLLYMWHKSSQVIFGGKNQRDMIAFFIMAVTGINLGLTAISNNIGMSLVWGMPIADILFKLTAILYLGVAYYLWKRWSESGEKLF